MQSWIGATLVAASAIAFGLVLGGEVYDAIRRGYKFYERWDWKYIAKHLLIEGPVFTVGVLVATNVIK